MDGGTRDYENKSEKNDRERANSKKVLRFYFSADRMNEVLDRLIYKNAMGSLYGDRGVNYYADSIIKLTDTKYKLCGFWRKLDYILGNLEQEDRCLLERYAFMRCGPRKLGEQTKRDFHRAIVKFNRKASFILNRHKEEVDIICEYYSLL